MRVQYAPPPEVSGYVLSAFKRRDERLERVPELLAPCADPTGDVN